MRRKRLIETIKEPVEKELDDFAVGLQFNWYRLNFSEKQAKEFLIDYAATEQQKKLLRKLNYIKLSYGWVARMLSNQNKIPEKFVTSLSDYLDNLTAEVQKEKQYSKKTSQLKIIDKRDRVLEEAYGHMEDAIDILFESKGKDTSFTAKNFISLFGLNKKQCKSLSEDIEKEHISYLKMAEHDDYAMEAFSFLSKPQRKSILKELVKLKNELEDASQHKERKRTVVKKEKNPEDKVKALKFKDTAFNCRSIDLSELIGKKTMFVASDDKRTLFCFTSKTGFDIRSSFISNIDTAERIISYGKGLEDCVGFVCKTKNPAALDKIEKHVHVSRKENVELKNNEYRSTDKFCVIKAY